MVWTVTKENAALASLVGVVVTLLVTTMLTQLEGIRQRDVESDRAKVAAAEAERQARQESLQTYLGDMGELILRDTSPLPEASPDDAVSQLARAKTLTVLDGLSPGRKGIVIRFLREAQLIQRDEGQRAPIITLFRADLSDADLSGANLSGAFLGQADLRDADLSGTDLSDADLSGANLSDPFQQADLANADLSRANLANADLPYAYLRDADLSGADLRDANLEYANLRDADLRDADLSGADLHDADLIWANLHYAQGVTKDQLEQQALTLEGATMPDGSVHP